MSAAVAIAPPTAKSDVEVCWTIEDVARYLRAGRTTVLLWIEQGKLPRPKRVGRRLLWDPAAIRSLVAPEG